MSEQENIAPQTKSKGSKHSDPDYKGEPIDAELEKGPIEKRSCQDILCCLIFVAYVIGMIAASSIGYSNGQPELLAAPYDSDGTPCGIDEYEEYPFLYFAVPYTNYLQYTTCIKECPTYQDEEDYPTNLDCKTNSLVQTCEGQESSNSAMEQFAKSYVTGNSINTDKIYIYNTTGFAGRFCIPAMQYFSYFSSVGEQMTSGDTLEKWFADVETSWTILSASLGIAFLVGLFYMVFVRYCAGVVVWISIIMLLVSFAGVGYYCYLHAQELADEFKNNTETTDSESSDEVESSEDPNANTIKALRIMAYVFWGLTGFAVLSICCLFGRIRVAIAIIKTAADYVKDTISALLIPIVMLLILGVFYLYWCSAAIYLYSYGDFSKQTNLPFAQVEWSTSTKRLVAFHLFGGLWFNAFIIAGSQFVLASSAALWYFNMATGGAHHTIRRSVYRLFRYHLGSIAFGSCILAIIQFIRILWQYVQSKLKPYQDKTGGFLIKYAVWYITCYLACFERFIKFINKNAYIQIALEGKSFCKSAMSAFYMILRNAGMFMVVGGLGEVFVALGKWMIGMFTAGIGYLILTRVSYYSDRLYSALLPAFIIFCLGYGIGALFMSVYGMAADTILQCYILSLDLENNHHIDVKAPPALDVFLSDNETVLKKKEEKKN